MIIALSDTHQFIRADEAYLSDNFKCPGCRKKVILKKGQIKIPHFAHLKKEGCSTFSEGETEEHLKGKLDLYNGLKKMKLTVQLEPYLSELQQRPDILTIIDGTQIVIEFQCSPIPIESIVKRTEGYLSKGYKVIWIVGQKVTIKGTFTAAQRAYIGEYKGNCFFLHYNYQFQKLFIYSHINTGNKGMVYQKSTIGNQSSLLKELMSALQKKRKAIRTYSNLENKKKHLAIMSYQKQSHSREFFSLMYTNHDSLQSIPLLLFETVADEWMIKSFSYQWKYEFLIWIEHQPGNRVLTRKIVKKQIDDWHLNKKIHFYSIPNIPYDFVYTPFFQFLTHLEKEQIVRVIGEGKWKVLKKADRLNTSIR